MPGHPLGDCYLWRMQEMTNGNGQHRGEEQIEGFGRFRDSTHCCITKICFICQGPTKPRVEVRVLSLSCMIQFYCIVVIRFLYDIIDRSLWSWFYTFPDTTVCHKTTKSSRHDADHLAMESTQHNPYPSAKNRRSMWLTHGSHMAAPLPIIIAACSHH